MNESDGKNGIFSALRTARGFSRRQMGFLQTYEDCDLLLEIGYRQEQGKPLTVKELQLCGLVTVPTLQRRLRRLRQASVLVVKRSAEDGRAVELRLSPRAMRAYQRYAALLKSTLLAAEEPASLESEAGE